MVNLYSTQTCSKCHMLKARLESEGIEFKEINNIELMVSKGFSSVPMLEVSGAVYDFNEAIKWVDERKA